MSATESLCEHDRGRSRTPRTATAVSRHRSSGRGWLRATSAAFQHARTRPTETSRARGRIRGVTALLMRRLSTRSLASRALPRPARLEHLVSRSRRGAGWSLPFHVGPRYRAPTDLASTNRREALRPEGTAFPPSFRRAHGLDGLFRGSPGATPRRAAPGTCPEVLSVAARPLTGRPNPQPVPKLWIMTGAFSIHRDPAL